MTEQAHNELLADVLSRYEDSPNPRLREITEAAVRHLHAFVEEVGLQRDEWFAGIQFLTATGQMCDEHAPGVHPPVRHAGRVHAGRDPDPRRHRGHDREHRARAVLRARLTASARRGESMLVDPDDGDRVVIRGTVRDTDGVADRRRRRWTAGRTPRPASTPSSSPASSRPRTCAASTRPTPTAATRSAPCAPCRTRSRRTGRPAICSRPTAGAGCAPVTPTCGCGPTATRT